MKGEGKWTRRNPDPNAQFMNIQDDRDYINRFEKTLGYVIKYDNQKGIVESPKIRQPRHNHHIKLQQLNRKSKLLWDHDKSEWQLSLRNTRMLPILQQDYNKTI